MASSYGTAFQRLRWAAFFQVSVARGWRLEHALRSGNRSFSSPAAHARLLLAEFVAQGSIAHRLAQDLLTLLERVVRTSCAAETINSVLRPFRESRHECTDQTSRQLFLLGVHEFLRFFSGWDTLTLPQTHGSFLSDF